MKNYLLVVILLLACSSAEAQATLKVRSSDNTTPISISLNDLYIVRRGPVVNVNNIPPGEYVLRIYTPYRNRRGKWSDRKVYRGSIALGEQSMLIFTFDHATGFTNADYTGAAAYAANPSLYNKRQPQAEAFLPPPVQNTTLSYEKLDKLSKQVAVKTTDMQKAAALRAALKGEQIVTEQVSEMMDWFTFEASKVDFAKWAYNIITDKEHYTELENKFTYKSYQDELDQFIKSQH